MTDIKFCGLQTRNAVWTALDVRARWAGFVHFPSSPRHITPADAEDAFRPAIGHMESVSVTVDADDDLLSAIKTAFAPHWIQLHGAETSGRVSEARQLTGAKIIKALPVADADDLTAAKAYDGIADMILFDAKPPKGASRPGGWGTTYDYALLKSLNITTPWLLSGGLDAANVRAAVEASGAAAVDVSSGIENAPGEKSATRMKAFAGALNG
ncbi:MAG: N-(5'-phosphoribosyl)anthranilate isomerase [Hyphobacterium sp.]|nr:MAG: N-(5'-phosphoribosyl)anthranilate isomerase [Hyphobacterium sp.]